MATHNSSPSGEPGTYTNLGIIDAGGDIVFKIRKFEGHQNQEEASVSFPKTNRQPVLIASDVLRAVSPSSLIKVPELLEIRLSQLRREGHIAMLLMVARRALALANEAMVDREKEAEAAAEREELARVLRGAVTASGQIPWEDLSMEVRAHYLAQADAAKAYFLAAGENDE